MGNVIGIVSTWIFDSNSNDDFLRAKDSLPEKTSFFAPYYIMGGHRFERRTPETFLFGDISELKYLGNKPTLFPYKAPLWFEPVRTLKCLLHIRKDSIKITKRDKASDYRIEFLFDCDVKISITLFFCAKEKLYNGRLQYIINDPCMQTSVQSFDAGCGQIFKANDMISPELIYKLSGGNKFSKTDSLANNSNVSRTSLSNIRLSPSKLNNLFRKSKNNNSLTNNSLENENKIQESTSPTSSSHPKKESQSTTNFSINNNKNPCCVDVLTNTIAISEDYVPSAKELDQLPQYPVVICCNTQETDLNHQVHITLASIESSRDGSTGGYVIKPLKQKLICDGLCYLIQELYGIENKNKYKNIVVYPNNTENIVEHFSNDHQPHPVNIIPLSAKKVDSFVKKSNGIKTKKIYTVKAKNVAEKDKTITKNSKSFQNTTRENGIDPKIYMKEKCLAIQKRPINTLDPLGASSILNSGQANSVNKTTKTQSENQNRDAIDDGHDAKSLFFTPTHEPSLNQTTNSSGKINRLSKISHSLQDVTQQMNLIMNGTESNEVTPNLSPSKGVFRSQTFNIAATSDKKNVSPVVLHAVRKLDMKSENVLPKISENSTTISNHTTPVTSQTENVSFCGNKNDKNLSIPSRPNSPLPEIPVSSSTNSKKIFSNTISPAKFLHHIPKNLESNGVNLDYQCIDMFDDVILHNNSDYYNENNNYTNPSELQPINHVLKQNPCHKANAINKAPENKYNSPNNEDDAISRKYFAPYEGLNEEDEIDFILAQSECVVCLSRLRDTVLLPCRHLCLCYGCATVLRYQDGSCPICRIPFKILLRFEVMRKVTMNHNYYYYYGLKKPHQLRSNFYRSLNTHQNRIDGQQISNNTLRKKSAPKKISSQKTNIKANKEIMLEDKKATQIHNTRANDGMILSQSSDGALELKVLNSNEPNIPTDDTPYQQPLYCTIDEESELYSIPAQNKCKTNITLHTGLSDTKTGNDIIEPNVNENKIINNNLDSMNFPTSNKTTTNDSNSNVRMANDTSKTAIKLSNKQTYNQRNQHNNNEMDDEGDDNIMPPGFETVPLIVALNGPLPMRVAPTKNSIDKIDKTEKIDYNDNNKNVMKTNLMKNATADDEVNLFRKGGSRSSNSKNIEPMPVKLKQHSKAVTMRNTSPEIYYDTADNFNHYDYDEAPTSSGITGIDCEMSQQHSVEHKSPKVITCKINMVPQMTSSPAKSKDNILLDGTVSNNFKKSPILSNNIRKGKTPFKINNYEMKRYNSLTYPMCSYSVLSSITKKRPKQTYKTPKYASENFNPSFGTQNKTLTYLNAHHTVNENSDKFSLLVPKSLYKKYSSLDFGKRIFRRNHASGDSISADAYLEDTSSLSSDSSYTLSQP